MSVSMSSAALAMASRRSRKQHGLGDAEREREPDERPQLARVVVPDRAVDDRADHERDERLAQHRAAGENTNIADHGLR